MGETFTLLTGNETTPSNGAPQEKKRRSRPGLVEAMFVVAGLGLSYISYQQAPAPNPEALPNRDSVLSVYKLGQASGAGLVAAGIGGFYIRKRTQRLMHKQQDLYSDPE